MGAVQEQIETAAKLANAHDFISTLPDGYSTVVSAPAEASLVAMPSMAGENAVPQP